MLNNQHSSVTSSKKSNTQSSPNEFKSRICVDYPNMPASESDVSSIDEKSKQEFWLGKFARKNKDKLDDAIKHFEAALKLYGPENHDEIIACEIELSDACEEKSSQSKHKQKRRFAELAITHAHKAYEHFKKVEQNFPVPSFKILSSDLVVRMMSQNCVYLSEYYKSSFAVTKDPKESACSKQFESYAVLLASRISRKTIGEKLECERLAKEHQELVKFYRQKLSTEKHGKQIGFELETRLMSHLWSGLEDFEIFSQQKTRQISAGEWIDCSSDANQIALCIADNPQLFGFDQRASQEQRLKFNKIAIKLGQNALSMQALTDQACFEMRRFYRNTAIVYVDMEDWINAAAYFDGSLSFLEKFIALGKLDNSQVKVDNDDDDLEIFELLSEICQFFSDSTTVSKVIDYKKSIVFPCLRNLFLETLKKKNFSEDNVELVNFLRMLRTVDQDPSVLNQKICEDKILMRLLSVLIQTLKLPSFPQNVFKVFLVKNTEFTLLADVHKKLSKCVSQNFPHSNSAREIKAFMSSNITEVKVETNSSGFFQNLYKSICQNHPHEVKTELEHMNWFGITSATDPDQFFHAFLAAVAHGCVDVVDTFLKVSTYSVPMLKIETQLKIKDEFKTDSPIRCALINNQFKVLECLIKDNAVRKVYGIELLLNEVIEFAMKAHGNHNQFIAVFEVLLQSAGGVLPLSHQQLTPYLESDFENRFLQNLQRNIFNNGLGCHSKLCNTDIKTVFEKLLEFGHVVFQENNRKLVLYFNLASQKMIRFQGVPKDKTEISEAMVPKVILELSQYLNSSNDVLLHIVLKHQNALPSMDYQKPNVTTVRERLEAKEDADLTVCEINSTIKQISAQINQLEHRPQKSKAATRNLNQTNATYKVLADKFKEIEKLDDRSKHLDPLKEIQKHLNAISEKLDNKIKPPQKELPIANATADEHQKPGRKARRKAKKEKKEEKEALQQQKESEHTKAKSESKSEVKDHHSLQTDPAQHSQKIWDIPPDWLQFSVFGNNQPKKEAVQLQTKVSSNVESNAGSNPAQASIQSNGQGAKNA